MNGCTDRGWGDGRAVPQYQSTSGNIILYYTTKIFRSWDLFTFNNEDAKKLLFTLAVSLNVSHIKNESQTF
jgi:hypothetical protein